MSIAAMERAWAAVPRTGAIQESHGQLLGIADKVTEEIYEAPPAAPNAIGFSALVIASDRIIEAPTTGALQAFNYADLKQVQIVGGDKKRFSNKYETHFLRIQTTQGRLLTYPLFSSSPQENAYNERLGQAAVNAHQRAIL